MRRKQFGSLQTRFKQASSLALVFACASLTVGGCGDEPSVFPKTPSLGPAPKGGSSNAGSTGNSTGNLNGQGGMAGDSGGNEGGDAPSTAGTTSGGRPTGGTSNGGSGGGDPNPLCGNTQIDGDEECDDGNRISGDGCSAQCKSKCEECESVKAAYWNPGPPTTGDEDWYDLCYRDETSAEGGPAAGVSRADLCHDAVECIRQTGCARITKLLPGKPPGALALYTTAVVFTPCFCENELPPDASPIGVPDECYSEAKAIKGPCYDELLEASEGDTTADLTARLTRQIYPLGRAYNLLNETDWFWCKEECLPVTCGETGGCLMCDEITAPNPQCTPP